MLQAVDMFMTEPGAKLLVGFQKRCPIDVYGSWTDLVLLLIW